MKKVLVLAVALMATILSARAEVEFAYDAGAEIVSSYIWRGQYNGGLSFQPDVEVGFDGEHSSFRAGVWANIGASDWGFRKGLPTYIDPEDGVSEINPNTRFMPEIDIVLSYKLYGLSLGANHYYYCDGSNFFSWGKDATLIEYDDAGNEYCNTTSTTEVWAGYNFGELTKAGLFFNWYTTVAGGDFNDDNGKLKRAWSSYFEIGYEHNFEDVGITFDAVVGMSPWKSPIYGNEKFAVNNISLKLNKEWEFDNFTLDLFAQGSLNTDQLTRENVFIKASGDAKLYKQKLNGVIGLGFWF